MKRLIILLLISMRVTMLATAGTTSGAALDSVAVHLDSVLHATCFGENDGATFVSITHGTAPFTFLWSNGDTLQNADSLAAGYYSLTVTDADGDQATLDSVEIGQPQPLELRFATVLDPGCGGQLGALSLEASGGTLSYQFLWNTGSTDPALVDLAAGDYAATATDANGCTSSLAISLQPNFPIAALTADGNITCTRPSVVLDGSASSQGGDFVFSWRAANGGHFTSALDTLVVTADSAGTYVLEILDTLNGCSSSDTIVVVEDFVAPVADAGTGGTLNCAAPSLKLDGSASSQGPNFTYAWTTADGQIAEGSDSLSPTVDAPGTYTLTVTNTLNGCTDDGDVVVDADFVAPTGLSTAGGTITCFEPTLVLQADYDTTNATFAWSSENGFSSTDLNPTVGAGGDYYFTVTDTLNGCSTTDTATVIAFLTAPDLALTAGTILCSATSVTIQTETQASDVVFYWAGPGSFASTEQNPVVTLPGLYEVVGQDTVYGCIALDSVEVGIDTLAPLADAGAGFSLNCQIAEGNLNGSASSQGNFSYLWTTLDGQIAEGNETLTPLVSAAGTYTLTVTNPANGCTATDDVVVGQRQPIAVQILDLQNVSCHGTATGIASVTGLGGAGSYSYVWSNGSLEATTAGLVAGTYTVVVTDADGCSAAFGLTVSEPDPLAANTTATGQSLAGVNDGTASANPSGGTAPYDFEWSNGATTQGLANLTPGAYTVTVTDDKGCTAVETANVNEFPCTLTGSVTPQQATCFGAADGSALVVLSDATSPVHFSWSNGDTLALADSLAAGIYSVTVSDSTNCSLLFTLEITQPTEISVFELFHEDAPCPTDATGSVTVAVNGGVQPYQFNWSNGSTEATANGLSIGEHSLTLTDANGCGLSLTTTILGTDAVGPTVVVQDLTVSLDENGTAGITPEMLDAGSFDNCGIASWSVAPNSFDCSQLGEQVVALTVTDANGNSNQALAIVTVVDAVAPVLTCPENVALSRCDPALTFALPDVADNCPVDAAQILQTEGFTSGTDFPLGETIQSFSYTDASGNSGTCSFTVTVSNALEAALTSTDASCHGACDGTASLSANFGIAPYSVLWSNGATSLSLSGLCAGAYTATLTDASGCEVLAAVQIAAPAELTVTLESAVNPVCASDLTGQITVGVAGGILPYFFDWTNASGSTNIMNLGAGTYILALSDANGCTATLTETLTATDTEAPVLALANITVSLDANGTATLSPAMFDAGSTDNCGIANWSISLTDLDCSDLGIQTVVLTATDGSGNSSTGTATVTVTDNTVPTLVCPASITVGFCAAAVQFTLPQVTDNCAVNPAALLQTAGLATGSNFPVGITTQLFTYTDGGGNAATCSFTVTVNAAASFTSTLENVSCNDDCDGSAVLDISGGAAPFTIQWSNGQTGTTATGLCAGSVSATVTDANGCAQVFTSTIIEPTALGLAINGVVNDEDGTGVGSITVTVSGGTAPYSFAWTRNGQPFATTEDLSNLSAGNYALLVTDANGCTIVNESIIVDNLTSTGEPAWATGLNISPNPAADWVQLTMPLPLSQAGELQILDPMGRVVFKTQIGTGETSLRLDVRDLPGGMYSLRLRQADSWAVRKLIINK